MTRPMPGPPPYGHYSNYYPHEHPDDALGLCPGCDIDGQGRRASSAKRLTDAECAAEFWRAMNETNSASLNNCPECPGCQAIVDEELTWHRFAIYPHALEANGAAS